MKRKMVVKKVGATKKTEDTKATDTAEGKVFDISHPGKSMPSSSSRPIIVSHKPSAGDPMVSPKNSEEKKDENNSLSAGEGTEMVMAAPKKNRIEPLHTDVVAEDTPSENTESPKTSEGHIAATDDIKASDTESIESDSPLTDQDDTKQTGHESSDEISDIAAEVTTKKATQNEAAKKEAEATKRRTEVEALINNKQFFVPINAVQKRRSMKLVVGLLVLLIATVAFLVALDAELLDIGVTPPTDFL